MHHYYGDTVEFVINKKLLRSKFQEEQEVREENKVIDWIILCLIFFPHASFDTSLDTALPCKKYYPAALT